MPNPAATGMPEKHSDGAQRPSFSMIACMVLWPSASFLILCGWAVFILIMNTILKIAAAVFHIFPKPPRHVAAPLDPDDLPIVTLLVPLFRERDVAGALVQRLSKLD